MTRLFAALVVVLSLTATSCRLFGQGIPCNHDDNCPGNAKCGLDGFCGTPGSQNGPATVATLKGRAPCSSSDDCGGDECSNDGTCAVTTFLDAGAPVDDVRAGGTSLAFVIGAASAFTQCNPAAVGIVPRGQAPGGTFAKHDNECGAADLSAGNVIAWDVPRGSGQITSVAVRELDGASVSDAAVVDAGQNPSGLGVRVAVSGERVLWSDTTAVHGTGTSSTIALPEKVDPIFGVPSPSAMGADDREIWGVGKQLVVADADPAKWSAAKTFTAPSDPPQQIVLGATRVFMAAGIVNNQTKITSTSRDDPSSAGVVVDTIDGDNTGFLDMAAAGDNLLVVTNTEIRLYPADGSAHVSIATASSPLGIAFADGFAWWADGDTIKRVRLTK